MNDLSLFSCKELFGLAVQADNLALIIEDQKRLCDPINDGTALPEFVVTLRPMKSQSQTPLQVP